MVKALNNSSLDVLYKDVEINNFLDFLHAILLIF